jgi:hypothetical protein
MKFYSQSTQILKYKIKKNQLQKGTKRKNFQLSQPTKQYIINSILKKQIEKK